MYNVWHSTMVYFGCDPCRILWIIMKCAKAKVCVVVHGPTEGHEKRDFKKTWIE